MILESFNWFQVVQTISIITTLLITVFTIRQQVGHLRVSNTLLIAQYHRQLWTYFYSSSRLQRIFEKVVDLRDEPVTDEEFMFVNMLFLHMSACYKAELNKSVYPIDGMDRDLFEILQYPIPRHVWNKASAFHDKLFISYVSAVLKKYHRN